MNKLYTAITVAFMAISCHKTIENQHNEHEHEAQEQEISKELAGNEAHEQNAHLEELISHSYYTENTEFFVQFESLLIKNTLQFTIHLTDTKTFKPIDNVEVKISLSGNGKSIETIVKHSDVPGIYTANLKATKSGVYDLEIEFASDKGKEKAVIKNVEVFQNEHEALEAHLHIADGDKISYLKEQAWESEFSSILLQPTAYREVIHTSGEILHAHGDEFVISATATSFVFFNQDLMNGYQVSSGATLLSLSGKELTDDNLETKFYTVKANYTKNKIEFERAEKLFQNRLITENEYLEKKNQYDNSKIAFEKLSSNFSSLGQKIKAPKSGFVKDIFVTQGQFVEAGQPLLSISQNRKLIVKADVSQEYFATIAAVSSANFKTSYSDKIYSIEELNGKLLSYDKSLDKKTHFASVFFEIDNSANLMSGSYVEIYLKSKSIFDALVIPETAILEEYGKYFVYVQVSGEKFEKRYIHIGGKDGINAQILSGLAFGERVVTRGAYEIKLSSMSGSLPDAHAGHNH